VIFFVVLAAFFLLPVLAKPFVVLLDTASQSKAVIYSTFGMNTVKPLEGECIVTDVPPVSRYDTIGIHCKNGKILAIGDYVFTVKNNKKYWIGNVGYVDSEKALVDMNTNPSANSFRVNTVDLQEHIVIKPIGGGAFYAQLPAGIEITTGSDVHDMRNGFLIGFVSATSLESSTLMQHLYVRTPISFERLETVTVEKI
jgi:hypothetical protein